MLVIQECKNTRAVTIFIRGGNKMVSTAVIEYCVYIYVVLLFPVPYFIYLVNRLLKRLSVRSMMLCV